MMLHTQATATTPELKAMMEDLVVAEIRRLTEQSDIFVFALYDPEEPDAGPAHFFVHDAMKDGPIDYEPALDFEGIGVWYICNRRGETFHVRHILIKVEDGRFVHAQVGDFEGFWEDWPAYVAEDRWVKALRNRPGTTRFVA